MCLYYLRFHYTIPTHTLRERQISLQQGGFEVFYQCCPRVGQAQHYSLCIGPYIDAMSSRRITETLRRICDLHPRQQQRRLSTRQCSLTRCRWSTRMNTMGSRRRLDAQIVDRAFFSSPLSSPFSSPTSSSSKRHIERRFVKYSARQLFEIVADVDSYK